jgi:hypothetical protein
MGSAKNPSPGVASHLLAEGSMAIKHSGCQARRLVIAGKSLKSKGNRDLQGYAVLWDRQSFD